MTKFIVIYHAPSTAMAKMKGRTPDEMKRGMKSWMEWAAKAGDKLVDLGSPLGNGKQVNKSGTSDSRKEVVGYSILQAENFDEAVGVLEGHPHLQWTEGCSIEVHEALQLPGSDA